MHQLNIHSKADRSSVRDTRY